MSHLDLDKIQHYKDIGISTDDLKAIVKHMYRADFAERCLQLHECRCSGQRKAGKAIIKQMQDEYNQTARDMNEAYDFDDLDDPNFYLEILESMEKAIAHGEHVFYKGGMSYIIHQMRLASSEFFITLMDLKSQEKDTFDLLHSFDKKILNIVKEIAKFVPDEEEFESLMTAMQATTIYREFAED